MMITLSADDLAGLSEVTRNELLDRVDAAAGQPARVRLPHPAPELNTGYDGIELTDREDVTFKHVRKLMEGLSVAVHNGLRLMAETGPVIRAQALIDAGISPRHFQSATTRRVRALTRDDSAFLLGWDHWDQAQPGQGRFALTPITHQTVRRYFMLD